MSDLRPGRYLLEWLVLMGGLCAAGALLSGRAFDVSYRSPALLGIACAGIADLVVFLVVGQALVRCPEGVINRWLLSILGKLGFFGASTGLVAWLARALYKPFLLALFAAFAVLTFHQVLRLVQAGDRLEQTGLEGHGAPGSHLAQGKL